ncbi:uncharacterized protein LOC124948197 isoform X1 [Vespa velutina]|uniref:uncharacterized protein LOC124948197 isoform X1 n=2 Tax=Vespa velutina TaxID=202808 RepID=UPI001FB1AD2B|nr:uncharacterized protein LOC124948197 isoform X1 [Vespa velutina]
MSASLTKMTFCSIFKSLFRKTVPIMCFSSFFVKCSSKNESKITEEYKLKLPDVNTLTYNYMINQSTLNAVNNASELLTIIYTAIEAASVEYRTLLIKLINLHKDSIENEFADLHGDAIVQIRGETQDKKETLIQLISFMELVRKMADSTTDICYTYGMNSLCSTLSQRIHDAIKNVEKEIYNNQELEKEYFYIQQECIINTKES